MCRFHNTSPCQLCILYNAFLAALDGFTRCELCREYRNIGKQRKTRNSQATGFRTVILFTAVNHNFRIFFSFGVENSAEINIAIVIIAFILFYLPLHVLRRSAPCKRAFQRVRLCLYGFCVCGVSGLLCRLTRPKFALYVIPWNKHVVYIFRSKVKISFFIKMFMECRFFLRKTA